MTAADRDEALGKDADKDADVNHLGKDADKGNRLSCEFSRVPLEVISTAHRLGMPTKWAVLLYLCRYIREDDEGNLLVSFLRSKMGDVLHMTENQIRGALLGLKRSGILSVVKAGNRYEGTTDYRLNLGATPKHAPSHEQGATPGHEPSHELGATPGHAPSAAKAQPQGMHLGESRCNPRSRPLKSKSIYRYSYSSESTTSSETPTPPGDSPDESASTAWSGPRPMRRDPQVFHPARLGPGGRLGDILFGDGGCGDDGQDVG